MLQHSSFTMKMITCLISMLLLVIVSSAFVLQHNASQQRATKLQLNLKPTVAKQISFSKKAVTPNHDPSPNQDYDEDIFHRRIVHFEHQKKHENEDDKMSHKKSYGGWNQRQFAKSIDP